MKKRLLMIAVVILIGIVLLAASAGSIYKWKKLPSSLDQYYEKNFTGQPPQPPEYLIKMFELGGSMLGIIVNVQQGDMENARKSFTAFSKNYEASAGMVPEWRKYYDLKAVKRLGKALDEGNMLEVFEQMEKVGGTCSECHTETKPAVWNKYNWRDFMTVMMKTTNPEEPQLPYPEAKWKYLLPAFDGIGVNIMDGQPEKANQSFNDFKTMFYNMKDACSSCHQSEPKYYVSQDVRDMVDAMGAEISAGNLGNAENIRQGIGNACYRCHVIHEPAQIAKVSQR